MHLCKWQAALLQDIIHTEHAADACKLFYALSGGRDGSFLQAIIIPVDTTVDALQWNRQRENTKQIGNRWLVKKTGCNLVCKQQTGNGKGETKTQRHC